MKITEAQLSEAARRVGIPLEQRDALWHELAGQPDLHGRFEAAHVAYYFGATLVIGAMGWFMTKGWDSFAGWQLASVALGYAAVFLVVGTRLWQTSLWKIPGGLLATMAVCMTPLAVFGLEKQFGLWPADNPGSYTSFHPYINASWVIMEVATMAGGAIALRWFRFPFLGAPIAYASWYLSMDATALIAGREAWDFQTRCTISVIFGAVTLLVSYYVDRRTRADFGFWGYLFGLLTFTGGLTAMESGSELGKAGYFLIHLGFMIVSLLLRRKVFLVFGAFGVFAYLGNEAYHYFRDSVAFRFVLTIIGLALIFVATRWQKHQARLEARLRDFLNLPIVPVGPRP